MNQEENDPLRILIEAFQEHLDHKKEKREKSISDKRDIDLLKNQLETMRGMSVPQFMELFRYHHDSERPAHDYDMDGKLLDMSLTVAMYDEDGVEYHGHYNFDRLEWIFYNDAAITPFFWKYIEISPAGTNEKRDTRIRDRMIRMEMQQKFLDYLAGVGMAIRGDSIVKLAETERWRAELKAELRGEEVDG